MDEVKKKEMPVIKLKLITGNTNILKAIAEINVTGKKLETLIHTAAVSILVHVEKHREVSLANKLLDAIPNLARKNALRDWFITFGKFSYDEETKVMVFKKTGTTLEKDATQNPFWNFKPEAEYVPFDLVVAITDLVKRAESKKEKGNKQDKIPPQVLTSLRKVVNA